MPTETYNLAINALDEHQRLLKNDNSSSEDIEMVAEKAKSFLIFLQDDLNVSREDYGDKLEDIQCMLANYEANGLPTEGSGLA